MNADLITPGHVSIIQVAKIIGEVVIGLLIDTHRRLARILYELPECAGKSGDSAAVQLYFLAKLSILVCH